jgi:hypothetical protein
MQYRSYSCSGLLLVQMLQLEQTNSFAILLHLLSTMQLLLLGMIFRKTVALQSVTLTYISPIIFGVIV